MSEVYDYVMAQLKQGFRSANGMTSETRECIEGCFEQFASAMELVCPVAIQPTGHGLAMAYGPWSAPDDWVFGFATNEKDKNMVCSMLKTDIAKLVEKAEQYRSEAGGRGSIWAAVVEGIETGNMDLAVKSLFVAMKPGVMTMILDRMKVVEREGLTPILATLAYADAERKRAGGVSGVVVLPASLEAQLEAQGAK